MVATEFVQKKKSETRKNHRWRESELRTYGFTSKKVITGLAFFSPSFSTGRTAPDGPWTMDHGLRILLAINPWKYRSLQQH
jgi:hypothetical protein